LNEPDLATTRRLAERTLSLYTATVVIMLLGIGLLVAYSIKLGPLIGPGVEESFGIALALMLLMSAVIADIVDRTYRVWPLGRRVRPSLPRPVTESGIARFLRVVVLVGAGLALAYVVAGLLPLSSF
jgi:hypothetical protein